MRPDRTLFPLLTCVSFVQCLALPSSVDTTNLNRRNALPASPLLAMKPLIPVSGGNTGKKTAEQSLLDDLESAKKSEAAATQPADKEYWKKKQASINDELQDSLQKDKKKEEGKGDKKGQQPQEQGGKQNANPDTTKKPQLEQKLQSLKGQMDTQNFLKQAETDTMEKTKAERKWQKLEAERKEAQGQLDKLKKSAANSGTQEQPKE